MFRARKPTQREQDIYNDAARRGVGPRRRKDPNYDPRLNPKGDSNAGGLLDSLDQVFGKSSPWSKHSKDKAVKGKKAGVSYPGWKPPRGPPTESVRSVDSGSEAGGEFIPPGSPPISVARQPVSQANERCAPANSASSSAAGGGGSQFSVSNKGSSESGTEGPASDTEGPPSDTERPRRSMHDSLHDPALYRDAISPPPILEFLRATEHSQPAPVINDEDAMSRSDRPRARRTRSRNSQLSRSTKNSGAASVADSQDTARYARAPKSEKGSTRSSRPPSSTNPSTIRSSTSDSEGASSVNQEHGGSGRTSTQSSPPPSPGPSRPKGNPRASSAADGGKENSYVYQGKTHVIHKRGGNKENAQRPPSRSSRHSQAASLAGEKEDTRSVRSNNRSERGSEAGSQRRRSPIRLRGPSPAGSRRGAPSVTGEEEDTRSVRSSHRKVRGSEAGSHAGSRREMGMVVFDKKKKKNTPPSDQRR